jgi:hypothetical protein
VMDFMLNETVWGRIRETVTNSSFEVWGYSCQSWGPRDISVSINDWRHLKFSNEFTFHAREPSAHIPYSCNILLHDGWLEAVIRRRLRSLVISQSWVALLAAATQERLAHKQRIVCVL